MVVLSAHEGLPFFDRWLHGAHFMLCTFAVLVACVPLLVTKGTPEHKFAGLIYLPISFAALCLASFMAWREASSVLFCFNCFCAYLLLSGWRAAHEKEQPELIDWLIPVSLFVLSVSVALHALIYDTGKTSFYMMFFAINGFYLAWRDWKALRQRILASQQKVVFAGNVYGQWQNDNWMARHIAGMVGSVLANLSVVVLTLLPLAWHWLWPAVLIFAGLVVAWREHEKKQRVRKTFAPVLQPGFVRNKTSYKPPEDDFREAA